MVLDLFVKSTFNMPSMEYGVNMRTGTTFGLLSAFIAISIGFAFSLVAYGLVPKPGFEAGLFYGISGATVGAFCSFLGLALNRKSAA